MPRNAMESAMVGGPDQQEEALPIEQGVTSDGGQVGHAHLSASQHARRQRRVLSLTERESIVREILEPHQLVEGGSINAGASLHRAGRRGVPFYAPPVQRQRWGETTSLPHVNWGDMFYDLFYVAAAYNLGGLYITAIDHVGNPDSPIRGLLYFGGAFGAIWSTWYHKYSYDARYVVVDYAHRFIDLVRTLSISLSILHIKSFEIFSDPRNPSLFIFSLGLLAESLINLLLWLELWLVGRGGPEIKEEAKYNTMLFMLPTIGFYSAAAVVAGVHYFSALGDHNNASGGGHRLLGIYTDPSHLVQDEPIWIILIGYVVYQVTMVLWAFFLHSKHLEKMLSVPANIDFSIHRFGEWVMLILGESVLSLLIVTLIVEEDYYFIVFVGVLTVVMVQFLHFESQPSHAQAHAMQKVWTGVAYVEIIQVYSCALIILGASYKYMLDLVGHGGEEEYGKDGGSASSESSLSRLLASGIIDPVDKEASEVAVVWMYGISLMVTLIALEAMLISHEGSTLMRCLQSKAWKGNPRRFCLQIFVVVLKTGLVIMLGLLPSTTLLSPNYATVFGGTVVFVFFCTRMLGLGDLSGDLNTMSAQENGGWRVTG